MRKNRPYGSEGGEAQTNEPSRALSGEMPRRSLAPIYRKAGFVPCPIPERRVSS